jgi:bifunctional non-homologous end joining protein LigD
MGSDARKVGKYIVALSNQEKILFPRSKITKGDLVDYYERIAPAMLLYMKNRPVTMHRYPDGITKEGFYQKDAADYFPDYIMIQPVKRGTGGVVNYPIINNAASLVYLANLACITPHLWLSRIDKLNHPDRMIFDFDPSPGVPFSQIREVARATKKLLEKLGLTTFIMTTGSRGVHVVVPLKRRYLFDEVREFAKEVARLLVERDPKRLTIEMQETKRGKRVFIDWLRNSWGATGVAPYAVRAKPGAPVATPISWDELSRVTPQQYTIKNIFQRIARVKDPWKDMQKKACALTQAWKKLRKELS